VDGEEEKGGLLHLNGSFPTVESWTLSSMDGEEEREEE
jgi:hypothetical protein